MKKLVKMLSVFFAILILFNIAPLPGYAESEEEEAYTIKGGVLTFKDGLEVIDRYSLNYFSMLVTITEVVIPDSVRIIGEDAFLGCETIKSVRMGSGIEEIGDAAFYACVALTEVTVPGNATRIGDMAFYGCSALERITLLEGVKRIEYRAFSECAALISVNIPGSVEYISPDAFRGCTALEGITVAESNPVYRAQGDCLIDTTSKTLVIGFNRSVIPDNGIVTAIGDGAFEGCAGLTTISIPNCVRSIGNNAFLDCSGLVSVDIAGSVTSIGTAAFYCAGLTGELIIPGSVTSIGESAFYGCSGLTSVTIGDGVTTISRAMFKGCTGLKSITIPKTVTFITMEAFDGCDDLVMRVYEFSYGWQYAFQHRVPYELIVDAPQKGDPDGDGKITVADALIALRVAAKLAEPTSELLACCDIDGDGDISVADALSILRVAAKLVDSL